MKKGKLIVLEGSERVGKTSIGKQLANRVGYQYRHFGAPNGEKVFGECWLNLEPGNYVLDRSWISRHFYGVYRDGYLGTEFQSSCQELTIQMGEMFDIMYVHVSREWDRTVAYHQEEISCGYTNLVKGVPMVIGLEEREREHSQWLNFRKREGIFSYLDLNCIPVFPLDNKEGIKQAVEELLPGNTEVRLREMLRNALTENERKVLSYTFRLNENGVKLTPKELSSQLNLSRSRISHILVRAINKMQMQGCKLLISRLMKEVEDV